MALPVHFFKHFCCRIYHLAATHSKKPNRQNFRIWNSYGQCGHVTMPITNAAFLAIWFCYICSYYHYTTGSQLKCFCNSGVSVYSNLFQPGLAVHPRPKGGRLRECFQSGIGETPSVEMLAMARVAEAVTTVGSRATWPKRPRHLC